MYSINEGHNNNNDVKNIKILNIVTLMSSTSFEHRYYSEGSCKSPTVFQIPHIIELIQNNTVLYNYSDVKEWTFSPTLNKWFFL